MGLPVKLELSDSSKFALYSTPVLLCLLFLQQELSPDWKISWPTFNPLNECRSCIFIFFLNLSFLGLLLTYEHFIKQTLKTKIRQSFCTICQQINKHALIGQTDFFLRVYSCAIKAFECFREILFAAKCLSVSKNAVTLFD